MVHYANPLFPLLITLLSSSLHNMEARESKFFAKAMHQNNNIVLEGIPVLAPTSAPKTMPPVSNKGYGLYGSDDENPTQSSKNEETTATNAYNNNNNNNVYTSYNYNNHYTYVNNDKYFNDVGISGSRSLDKGGKYYNDVGNEKNYYNGHEAGRESRGRSEGYFGNSENHEFDTMEEYERLQGYPETQGEYIP